MKATFLALPSPLPFAFLDRPPPFCSLSCLGVDDRYDAASSEEPTGVRDLSGDVVPLWLLLRCPFACVIDSGRVSGSGLSVCAGADWGLGGHAGSGGSVTFSRSLSFSFAPPPPMCSR